MFDVVWTEVAADDIQRHYYRVLEAEQQVVVNRVYHGREDRA